MNTAEPTNTPNDAGVQLQSEPQATDWLAKGGYWQIADTLDVQFELPREIVPGLQLSLATDEQLSILKQLLSRIGSFASPETLYENDWIAESIPHGVRHISTALPREKWRYLLLTYGGAEWPVYEFQLAAAITEPSLTMFAHVRTAEPFGAGTRVFGWGGDFTQATEWYQTVGKPATPYSQADFDHLIATYRKLRDLDQQKYLGISRALKAYQQLKRIPATSDLKMLGLFAIIEMLLTHNPNNKEIGDSVSHQLKTKIALLSPRFETPLDYTGFGASASQAKVWDQLYNYRSRLAHGDGFDFSKPPLSVLDSGVAALTFTDIATRRLLRHALQEPELLESLKPI